MEMWQSDHRRQYYGNMRVRSQKAIQWKCDSQITEGHIMEIWQSNHRGLIILYCKCDSSIREGYAMDMWQSYHRRPYYENSINLLPEKASFAMKTYSCQITECVVKKCVIRFQKVQYIQITQEYQMKINLCIFIYSYRIDYVAQLEKTRKKGTWISYLPGN